MKPKTINDLFPNAAARAAADKAIDALSADLPMTAFLDTWEAAYFKVAGTSPFRRPKK